MGVLAAGTARACGSSWAAMASLSGSVPGTNSTRPRAPLTGTTSYVRTCARDAQAPVRAPWAAANPHDSQKLS